MEPRPTREFSSLRDPSGFVFYFDGGVYRALDEEAHTVFQELSRLGLLDRLIKNGNVVGTHLVVPSDERIHLFKQFYPDTSHFIEHDPIATLTTPAEWTRSMLCDAALLELSLQEELLEAGFMLKDASAYNVQFKNSQPIHIDLPSIEKRGGGIWPAYGQFCRMFLFPLLLASRTRLPLKSYFLTYLNGMELEEVAHTMGFWQALRPSHFMDVFLPFVLQRLFRNKSPESLRIKVEENASPVAALRTNLRRLSKLVKSLRSSGRGLPSRWDRYTEENLYTAMERRTKREAVTRILDKIGAQTLVDLGCNTGEYTFLAAEKAKRVVAVESDHESLDRLYNKAKENNVAILPVWTDLLNPTPAMGLRNRERAEFQKRVRGDVVMALALVHHLITASNFPLLEIADMLFELTDKYLLVEYVSPNDPQFESLVGLRPNSYKELTETVFAKVFSERGRLLEAVRLNNFRTLFLFSKS